MEEKYYVEVPQEVVQEGEVIFKVVEDGLLLKKPKATQTIHVSWKSILPASIVVFISFALTFKGYSQIPLVGNKSTASLVIVFGVITGMLNFTYFFTKEKRYGQGSYTQKMYWRNYPTVLLTYLILTIVSLLFISKIIGELFVGVSFDIYTSMVIGTLLVSIVNYILIHIAQTLTPDNLIKSLIAIILGGVTIAMITNKDNQWWIYNLSFLGTPDAANSWQFNLTLMFSALLMIALIDYLFVLLYEILGKSKRLMILKTLLVITAICLGGVGFFPYNESIFSQQMHNRSAGYLVYLFIILIISIRWLLPDIGKNFLNLSYSIGLALLVAVVLFQVVGYLSLTAFEIIAFVLAFAWLLLLLQKLVNIVMHRGNEYRVEVIIK